MSYPAIVSDPWMKTPMEKVSPVVNGPSIGALVGQPVAVVDAVMQTRPVNWACVRGKVGTRTDPASTRVIQTRGRLVKPTFQLSIFRFFGHSADKLKVHVMLHSVR